MKLKSKTLSFPSPKPGITAYENTFYTRATGVEKMRTRILETADDIFEDCACSISTDNGKTWPESLPVVKVKRTSQGILRRFENTAFVDPVNGRLLRIAAEGVFRKDTLSCRSATRCSARTANCSLHSAMCGSKC